MRGKPLAIAVSVITIITILAAYSALTPLKQAWYGYLNDYAYEYYVDQLLTFNARKDLNLPQDAVLFYGDSLVQGLTVTKASGRAVNYGIGHATSTTVALQLQMHRNTSKAAVIVIAAGINDITRGKADQVLPAYRHALKSAPEAVPIIISKILPVSESKLRLSGVSREITKVNLGLDELCTGDPNTHCLDAGQKLANSAGQLDKRYHLGDGLHLNAAGNAIWLEQLESLINKVIATRFNTERDFQDG